MIRPPRPRPESRRAATRRRVTTEEGDIYAAATADGKWIKIGFSLQVADRIRALNLEYRGDAEFSLMATTRSTFRNEQKIHYFMQPLHQVRLSAGKEFYPVMPAVLEVVKELIEVPERLEIDSDWYLHLMRWGRAAAKEDHNRIPALKAHHEIVERNAAAEARTLARIEARMQAREAARAAREAAEQAAT